VDPGRAAAAKAGLNPAELSARFPRIAELPFDSGRKKMTTVHQLPGTGVRVICKGAPEAILVSEMVAGDAATVNQAIARAEELARDGFRVLAVAAAHQPGPPPAAEMERGLRLLGLIAIFNPPRASAAATIAACQAAGITPVLITGDHPATARAIATGLGLTATESLLVGVLGTVTGVAAGYGLLAWLTATTIAGVMPEIGVTAALSAGTVAAAVLLGTAAVAAAPLFTLRKLRRTDIPATLRVVE